MVFRRDGACAPYQRIVVRNSRDCRRRRRVSGRYTFDPPGTPQLDSGNKQKYRVVSARPSSARIFGNGAD